MAKKDKREKDKHKQTEKKRAPIWTGRGTAAAAQRRRTRSDGRADRRGGPRQAPVQVARPEARGQGALSEAPAPHRFSSWPSAASTTTPVLISSS